MVSQGRQCDKKGNPRYGTPPAFGRFRDPSGPNLNRESVIVITNQAGANFDKGVLAAFDLRQKPRSKMLRRFTNRFLAALAVASAAIVLVPIGARSQQV